MTDSCSRTNARRRTPHATFVPVARSDPSVCLAPSSDAVVEGADQPFWRVVVVYQARNECAPNGAIIARADKRVCRASGASTDDVEQSTHDAIRICSKAVVLVLVRD